MSGRSAQTAPDIDLDPDARAGADRADRELKRKLLISPHVGEMAGRPEGGAKEHSLR